jgi:antitoxin component of RelBE/YafQ-DinJ toxin-antitoxin module
MGEGKMLGARVDPEILARFHQICVEGGSSASDEIRRFVMAVVKDGCLPDDDERITPLLLQQRIRDVMDPRLTALENEIATIRSLLPENTENAENKMQQTFPTGTIPPVHKDEKPYNRDEFLESFVDPDPVEVTENAENNGEGFEGPPVEAIGDESENAENQGEGQDSKATENAENVISENTENDNTDNVSCSSVTPTRLETNEPDPLPEAIEPKESTKVVETPVEAIAPRPQKGDPFLPFPEGMPQGELAAYWGIDASAISQEKAKASFPRWSAGKDPEGLSWGWNGKKRKEGKYFVIGKP